MLMNNLAPTQAVFYKLEKDLTKKNTVVHKFIVFGIYIHTKANVSGNLVTLVPLLRASLTCRAVNGVFVYLN